MWRWKLTERLVDGQKGLNDKHGRSHNLRLLKDMASFSVQHAVDAADHLLWALREEETWVRDARMLKMRRYTVKLTEERGVSPESPPGRRAPWVGARPWADRRTEPCGPWEWSGHRRGGWHLCGGSRRGRRNERHACSPRTAHPEQRNQTMRTVKSQS